MLSSYPSQVVYLVLTASFCKDELLCTDDPTRRREAAPLVLCLKRAIPLPGMHWAGCAKAEGAKHPVDLLAILFSS